jgi:hypothetical protein
MAKMDFIKDMYEDGLVEKKLDEDAWADIRARRLERATKQRNIALYGYLVGIDNAMKARRFAELANEGKSIPSSFAQAYLPIVDMIDDIIEAGPSAIQQLKVVHKRAKKQSK